MDGADKLDEHEQRTTRDKISATAGVIEEAPPPLEEAFTEETSAIANSIFLRCC